MAFSSLSVQPTCVFTVQWVSRRQRGVGLSLCLTLSFSVIVLSLSCPLLIGHLFRSGVFLPSIHSLIHHQSFSKHSLKTCGVPGPGQGYWDPEPAPPISKTSLVPWAASSLRLWLERNRRRQRSPQSCGQGRCREEPGETWQGAQWAHGGEGQLPGGGPRAWPRGQSCPPAAPHRRGRAGRALGG